MLSLGIYSDRPLWEEKLSGFSTDGIFHVAGTFSPTDRDDISSSPVFSRSDIIWIPEYSDLAFECAVRAVKVSKHVLFGFPLCRLPEDACSLFHLANEARVQIQVGHHDHYNPAFRALRSFVRQPQYIDLNHSIGICGEDFADTLFHALLADIDLCISLVPDSLKKFQSHTSYIIEGAPPVINVRIEFNNGTAAGIRLDPFTPGRGIRIAVFQRGNILKLDLEKGTADIESFNRPGISGPGSIRRIWPQNNYPAPVVSVDDPEYITLECLSFINNLSNDRPPVSGLEQGCEALKICKNIFSKIPVVPQ
jgi:predicted dehydrogenase